MCVCFSRLKEKHKYMYQIQGQLQITGREYCDLVLYSRNDFHIERIVKNNSMWEEMLVKLKTFYFDCVLPEIVDPWMTRGMPIREPENRTEAHMRYYKNKVCPRKQNCSVCNTK